QQRSLPLLLFPPFFKPRPNFWTTPDSTSLRIFVVMTRLRVVCFSGAKFLISAIRNSAPIFSAPKKLSHGGDQCTSVSHFPFSQTSIQLIICLSNPRAFLGADESCALTKRPCTPNSIDRLRKCRLLKNDMRLEPRHPPPKIQQAIRSTFGVSARATSRLTV